MRHSTIVSTLLVGNAAMVQVAPVNANRVRLEVYAYPGYQTIIGTTPNANVGVAVASDQNAVAFYASPPPIICTRETHGDLVTQAWFARIGTTVVANTQLLSVVDTVQVGDYE